MLISFISIIREHENIYLCVEGIFLSRLLVSQNIPMVRRLEHLKGGWRRWQRGKVSGQKRK